MTYTVQMRVDSQWVTVAWGPSFQPMWTAFKRRIGKGARFVASCG